MHVNISGKGIHRRELPGVEKLRELPAHWYAFTNLELVQSGEMPRQLDVIIVLDDRILVVDLKDWRGKITSNGDRWFQDGRYVDTSPVKKVLENVRIMASLLTKFIARKPVSGARPKTPLIEGCVVLTSRCDISELPDMEKPRVLLMDEFCRTIKDPAARCRRFATPTWIDKAQPYTADSSRWRAWLGEFYGSGSRYFKPLHRRFGDYRAISDATYQHPKSLYSEYDVEEVTASRGSGLLRLWDFSKAGIRYASEEGRSEIAGREQNVITYLLDRSPDLETVIIRPKVADPYRGIHYWEIFEKRRALRRLRDFLRTGAADLTPRARVDLARTLLSHLATIHRLGAAHLDLGQHSVWIELPSAVRLSHLVAAAYPELGSLGDRRYEFLGNATVLPESIVGGAVDHFRKDVFLAGICIHSIFFGAAPGRRNENDAPSWDPAVDKGDAFGDFHAWFEKALDVESASRFPTAQEMLDAFNAAAVASTSPTGAIEQLLRHRRWKSMLEVYTRYPVQQAVRETDRVIAWRSEVGGTPYLVKAWRRACWGEETLEAPRLVRFCERAEDLILAQPRGLVRLLDVGYLGDHLVLIQDFVDAPNLQDHLKAHPAWLTPPMVLGLLHQLATIVNDLHSEGRYHGDLKPANILLAQDRPAYSVLLVDLLDFGAADEGEIRTPAYSPQFPVGARERDRFAVLMIARELLQKSAFEAERHDMLEHAIDTCLDNTPALATLEPFLEAVTRLLQPPAPQRPKITIRSNDQKAGPVSSDEGKYYVRMLDERRILITGATEELLVYIDRYNPNAVSRIHRQSVAQSRVAQAERRATQEIEGLIIIEPGKADYSELAPLIATLRSPGISEVRDASGAEVGEDTAAQEREVLDEDVSVAGELSQPASVDVPLLWRTLLQVEEELFTEGIAEEDSYFSRSRRRHFVPFQASKGTPDFTREDKVAVELATDSRWVTVGLLDLDLSRDDLIAVDASTFRARDGARLCRAGSTLRFRSMMEADSRSRRNSATSRLLARKAVLSNLVDYFDPRLTVGTTVVPVVSPSREHLRSKYGLNDSQATAFQNLLSRRPVGMLQGPPGTGKTKFIAALVHHALSSGIVRNVLLASQSHEAVNNAAEGILRLFRRERSEPKMVRVGQEGNISDVLKPYHSTKVEEHYREQFRAGLKERFRVAARHIGLPEQFADDLFFFESTLRPVFQQLQMLQSGSVHTDPEIQRMRGLQQTLCTLQSGVLPDKGPEINWNDPDAYDHAMEGIGSKYEIDAADQVRQLRGIAELARDWMGSVSSRRRSFEEFLAKTRHIVCGTCVGLGRSSLGLASAHFDLVVVDEAARCTPSELAVPIQTGRWIVLVGDHLQLEPFHGPDVVRETRRRLKLPAADIVRSDFERAFQSGYGRSTGQTLRTQYRMLPAIGKLVSTVFYGGQLQHGRTNPVLPDECCPEFFRSQLAWIATDDLAQSAFQVEAGGVGRSLCNPAEANAIIDLLRRLDDHAPFLEWLTARDTDVKPIGIICTYAAQRELMRRKLHSVGLSATMIDACKIDTVDSYQGKENPIVILSLVRNNADGGFDAGHKTIVQGFLSKPNRVNVALSRAMDRLVIVGRLSGWPSNTPMFDLVTEYRTMAEHGEAALTVATPAEAAADRPRRRRSPVAKKRKRPLRHKE